MTIRLTTNEFLPLEMHKVRIVQKLNLPPVEERRKNMDEAGFNTFLLQNRDVFLDMLTDSGVNAMSDNQQAAMFIADDAYAGSETFNRLKQSLVDVFHKDLYLPHSPRPCLRKYYCKYILQPGQYVPMNYHFTTTKAHIELNGSKVVELIDEKGIEVTSDLPFKGNMDIEKLNDFIEEKGC